VEPNQLIDVELIPAEVGSTVELTDVLMVANDSGVRVGTPLVEGARVIAQVVEHGKAGKVVVFKYHAKTRYRRKKGHRQPYTRLAIQQILLAGQAPESSTEEERPQRRRSGRARASAGAEEAGAGEETTRAEQS